MFEIIPIQVTLFQQNARILHAGQDAVVIDPGGDSDRILQALARAKLTCREIWLTHSHLDHCGGVGRLKSATGAKLYGHPAGAAMRGSVKQTAQLFGVFDGSMENCPEPDEMLSGGEELVLGESRWKTIFTPGHSPDHLCFYNPEAAILIAGDTLFAGSIGRTDLPGGDHGTLIRSIEEKIFTLPGATKVLPGHGPDTTVEEELENNPFF